MTDLTMRHVRWAAEECYWQQSGEPSVAWMLGGWEYACDYDSHTHGIAHLDFILRLGLLVEPRYNNDGLRTVDVRVGHDVKIPWRNVPDAMDRWLANVNDMTPTEAFRWYEEIHPFRDGNGRTGSIIYNLLNGTLHAPVHPPNLWNDPRRYEGEIRD